jgi:tyrosinase
LPFPHDTFRERDPADTTHIVVDILRSLDDLLAIKGFVDFSNALQDTHDAIHGWVGGVMSQVSFAAFDPIFWAHHCMVDRIWWMWQNRQGNSTMPEALLNHSLPPFGKTVREVLDVNELGYEYAGAASQPQ